MKPPSVAEPHRFEQERRFIVGEPSILENCAWKMIQQGYLWSVDGYAVRIRIVSDFDEKLGKRVNQRAMWAAKGPRIGDERREFEQEFPLDLAEPIVSRCEHLIEKRRYQFLDSSGLGWDIDVFEGPNRGLIIAEIEAGVGDNGETVTAEARQILRSLEAPAWAYREVTSDRRFNNEELAKHPVTEWDDESEWRGESVWDF